MSARAGRAVAAWTARLALVAACSACASTAPPPRSRDLPATAPPPAPRASGPLCGPWELGQRWPGPIEGDVEGDVEPLVGEGTLEGLAAATALLGVCGDRIAQLSCSVSYRVEESPFGDPAGTHVVARPAEAAAERVAQIRRRLAAEGFEETWAGAGSVPELEAMAAAPRGQATSAAGDLRGRPIDVSLLAAGEARGASVATRRGTHERILVVGCGSAQRCTVMVLESDEGCGAR